MVLAPDFERQNISLVTEQRLRSALTSFGLWPRSRCSVTREILISRSKTSASTILYILNEFFYENIKNVILIFVDFIDEFLFL
jgi:hypothetical protein